MHICWKAKYTNFREQNRIREKLSDVADDFLMLVCLDAKFQNRSRNRRKFAVLFWLD